MSQDIGHINVNGCIVCRGCGSLVYSSQDAIDAHANSCAPLRTSVTVFGSEAGAPDAVSP